MPFVLEHYGHAGSLADDGRWRCQCPFHADSDPSFDVYGDNLERWGCYPCGLGGDVFDLLQRIDPAAGSFPAAVDVALRLTAEMHASGWAGPTKMVKKAFDQKAAADRIASAYLAAEAQADGLEAFVAAKGYGFDADWLRDTFGVGTDAGHVIVPHLDRFRSVVGYKHRAIDGTGKAISAAGANFTALYGAWLDSGKLPVLLCEGESDVWAAKHAVGDRFDVLGLPTGAGTRADKFLDALAGRDVTLAFDGDDAGRRAVLAWYTGLVGKEIRARIVPMPDGVDLASHPDIPALISRARSVPAYPEDPLFVLNGGYARKSGKDGHTVVANWSFDPKRELTAEDGTSAYEGVLEPSGASVVLTSHDLSTKASVIKWCNRHGGAWFGSDRDAQVLLAMLQARGPFLAVGRMTAIAGLHDWHFVAPGIKVGPDYWQYVPPPGDIELESSIFLGEGPWSAEQVHILRTLHVRQVMDPILAWLAAAPLRSVLHSFPFLAVTGSSSTGKSTLTETVLRAFAGSHVTTNLTSTTRYAVSAMAEATNGIPVWFDEYRPGARTDTLVAVNQILRDAFDGAASARGGTKDHWAKVTRRAATAPLIVSGEDSFDETSLVQRMVSVSMPLQGKNPDVLARVQGWRANGLPRAYLEWLIGSIQLGRLWRFENYEVGPSELPSRNRTGIGVLDLGWRLLSRFVDEAGGADLGDPDWSLVIGEAAESATHSPIEDALRWAFDETDAQGTLIGRRGGDVWVRVQNLVQFVGRNSSFTLPGGTSAVKKYLQQHYGAAEGTVTAYGTQKRALVIPDGASRLGI